MKHIIIGTAGHIDHGKTALIKALTGINTDRLEEEQRRGISIVLGFAELLLPSGIQAGVIDVPGHERFVRNMLAGVAGIDLVLFVIAADEGVMPQTVEHLEILELLGVKKGIIVLSKIDMVDEEWLMLVEEDITKFLKNTFLENAPIQKISSVTGQGISDLINEIDQAANQAQVRSSEGIPRLPIDRVFTIQGIGTVVTGTLWSGSLNLKDMVEIQPANIQCKIRNIQVHDANTNVAYAGQRTAVALQGVNKNDLNRGDVLSLVGFLKPTYMIDAQLTTVRSLKKKIRNRQKVHFHLGTSEVLGNIYLLDSEEIIETEKAYAQIRLEQPVIAMKGDRFVIRQYSPVITIAGGIVLDADPPKHKRFQDDVNSILNNALQNNLSEIAINLALQAKFRGLLVQDIINRFTVTREELETALHDPKVREVIFQDDNDHIFHQQWITQIKKEIIQLLDQYHQNYPLRIGASLLEIRSQLPPIIPESVFQKIIDLLIHEKKLKKMENSISLIDYHVQPSENAQQIHNDIMTYYSDLGYLTPDLSETLKQYKQEDIQFLINQGKLIKINRTYIVTKHHIDVMILEIKKYFEKNDSLTVSTFKDLFGMSRKYAVPILEYLDEQAITRREGDVRVKNK